MIIFVFLVSVLLVFAIQYHFDRKKFFKFAENIPEKKPFGVLGHGPYLLGKNDGQKFKWLHDTCLEFNSLLKLRLGPAMIWIIVNEPRLIQKVLLSPNCLEKPFFYKFLRLDNGLISAKYEKWMEHRKFLNNSFNDKILQSFLPHFLESSNQMLKNLQSQFSKEEFNILDVTSKCTLTMLIGSTFGLNVEELQLNGDILQAFDKLTKLVSKRCREPLLYINPIYRVTKMFYRERKHRKTLSFYSDLILKERRELVGPINNNNNTNDPTSSKIIDEEMGDTQNSGKMFIDQLICHENKFTDDEIRDHVYSVVAAGYETSSLLTSYTLLLLAMHSNIQERVYEEINSIFKPIGVEVEIDSENLHKASYLDMVVKETMRLFPVTPIIGRKTHEEMELNELKFPEEVTLIINIFALHRRKDIWGENAELFNPDHFLPENIEKRHPYSYIPFSGGSRNCIGNKYAMLAIKIMLPVILLFVALAQCQETTEEESRSLNVDTEDKKDKRGISLNLGSGFDGYNYVNPLSRAYTRGYTAPINEFGGYDGVNYGIGSNGYNTGSYGGYNANAGGFGGGNVGGFSGYPSFSSGFGRYPGASSYNRVYSSPVSTFPLGGIGTVGPSFNGGGFGGYNGFTAGFNNNYNRYNPESFNGAYNQISGIGGNGYQQQYPQQYQQQQQQQQYQQQQQPGIY
ncbi:unnamed protein product [Diamesa serratosioi]